MKKDERKYPCPQCEEGELYDEGGMFLAIIKCTHCDYEDMDACGCVTS